MDKNSPPRLSFTFQMTISDYRRMMYFNSFARQRRQTIFLCIVWVISLAVILLEHFAVIAPLEKVTHGCLMLVSALLPFMALTAEFAVWRFKVNHGKELAAHRTLTLTEDGVEQTRDDRQGMGFEKWSDFDCIYETPTMFIFYRSAKQLTLLPKRAMQNNILPEVREILERNTLK